MSSDKMREEFENSPRFKGMDFARAPGHPDYYESPYANGAWDGWKASRESLVIELPEPYAVVGDYAACGGGRSVWDVEYAAKITDRMCEKIAVYDRACLEAAGVKVAQ
ncbi:MAG: hypothetical protein KKC55_16590 [Gammaproteobacteria bacterium]|uniref:Uncharacterized protein n=1 Tax=viral metagenome TaxID=1070528 RepID=A0A6M3M5X4_9ZZZZ|nr:hypothetical protein [Gammaproteobacteria bacterium]